MSDAAFSIAKTKRSKPIHIGSWSFPTKKAAERHIREILGRYADGAYLIGEDDIFMRACFEKHPNRDLVIDCGIKFIQVQYLPNNQRRFLIVRTDGSRRDVRWMKCLSPPSQAREVAGICRGLIKDQIDRFRETRYRGVCDHCGESCALLGMHVDHIPPYTFQALMLNWLKSIGYDLEDIEIVRSRAYQVNNRFADDMLEDNWIEYHETNARLRCLCPNCNLSATRKKQLDGINR